MRLIIACAVSYCAWVLINSNIWTISEESKIYFLLNSLNLGVHEVGHFIFIPVRASSHDAMWAVRLYFFGGSLVQWLVPLLISLVLVCLKRVFDAGVILLWFAQSLHSSVLYIADAKEMNLPLWGGDGMLHDWNQILSSFGALGRAQEIADFMLFIAKASAVLSVITIWSTLIYGVARVLIKSTMHMQNQEASGSM